MIRPLQDIWLAVYYDGERAVKRYARLCLRSEGMEIDAGFGVPVLWRYDENQRVAFQRLAASHDALGAAQRLAIESVEQSGQHLLSLIDSRLLALESAARRQFGDESDMVVEDGAQRHLPVEMVAFVAGQAVLDGG